MKLFKQSFGQIGILALLGMSFNALAGAVAPEKQAEYAQIMQLKERLENYFYVQRPKQDKGAIYSFVDDIGVTKKIYVDYKTQGDQLHQALGSQRYHELVNAGPHSIVVRPSDDEISAAPSDAHAKLMAKIKPLLLQDAQKARNKLLQIIAEQDQGSNHQLVAHLQKQLYEINEQNFILEEGVSSTANNLTEQYMVVSAGKVEYLPRTTTRLTLAHELGHSVGFNSFAGDVFNMGHLWSDEMDEEDEDFYESVRPECAASKDKFYAKIRQHHKDFAAYRYEQHPFADALKEYAKWGINGLDYFDSAKTAAVKARARDLFAKLKNEKDAPLFYIVTDEDDEDKWIYLPWQDEDWQREKAMEALYWHFILDEYDVDLRKRQALAEQDTALATSAGEITSAYYVNRGEEVLADHFAKLVLESEIQATADPQEKQRLALEGVLKFMISPDLATALKYHDRFASILDPIYLKFKEEQQAHPEWTLPLVEQGSDNKMEPHPTHAERLLILLTSPTIRDALKDI